MPLPFLSLISRCGDPIFVPRLKDGIRLDVNDEIIMYIDFATNSIKKILFLR